MNLSGLKLGVASRKARSLPKKERTFGEGRSIETIGIILDRFDEGLEQAFQDFVQGFHLKEGSAEIVYCLPNGLNNKYGDRTIFRGSDISWLGKVTNKRVTAFLDRRFDLVLCFTKNENKIAEYLLTVLDGGLKVGRQQEDGYLYDISISSSYEEVELFISEVKKYLKILNRIS